MYLRNEKFVGKLVGVNNNGSRSVTFYLEDAYHLDMELPPNVVQYKTWKQKIIL